MATKYKRISNRGNYKQPNYKALLREIILETYTNRCRFYFLHYVFKIAGTQILFKGGYSGHPKNKYSTYVFIKNIVRVADKSIQNRNKYLYRLFDFEYYEEDNSTIIKLLKDTFFQKPLTEVLNILIDMTNKIYDVDLTPEDFDNVLATRTCVKIPDEYVINSLNNSQEHIQQIDRIACLYDCFELDTDVCDTDNLYFNLAPEELQSILDSYTDVFIATRPVCGY
jgi:hypothetical protein